MNSPHTVAPRRATISDVAREAGTGKTSVSRYLNGELSVLSPELRARIEAAIERLDYQPNQMARGLKRGRNRLIGMLVADLTNPYSIGVLQGVEAACHALGLMPLICHAANEVEMERRYLQLLTTYRVEGVIVNALGVREETLRPVGEGGIPAVLVDRAVDGLVADLVGLDNTAAVELGTHHLLERGFDDIRFVVQPFEHVSSRRLREAAFRAVIDGQPRVRGRTVVLELGDAAAVEGTLAELDRALDVGLEGTAGGTSGVTSGITLDFTTGATFDLVHGVPVELTSATTPANTPGTTSDAPSHAGSHHAHGTAAGHVRRLALFAANAPVALCLARHLNARYGARWQERVALLCVDDPEWAEFAGITTIRQPTYQIGYRAVEFLYERIEGVQTAVRDCLLPGELIVRASTSR